MNLIYHEVFQHFNRFQWDLSFYIENSKLEHRSYYVLRKVSGICLLFHFLLLQICLASGRKKVEKIMVLHMKYPNSWSDMWHRLVTGRLRNVCWNFFLLSNDESRVISLFSSRANWLFWVKNYFSQMSCIMSVPGLLHFCVFSHVSRV